MRPADAAAPRRTSDQRPQRILRGQPAGQADPVHRDSGVCQPGRHPQHITRRLIGILQHRAHAEARPQDPYMTADRPI